ncbi:MAG: UDP-3-O-(3-hydroxymyristoyl)glucosamine N-acyltransferase [Ignavibacteriaceae bacterium]|nr:UDP-3-O-(3-hydroxymyristoyl)glucosamine N-acyltransferase [Ignavibacteriaceae bacterium]
MTVSVSEIAKLVGAEIIGDENLIINSIAKISDADTGSLTYLYNPSYEKYFEACKASAIIVKPDFNRTREDITYLLAPQPEKSFQKVVTTLFYKGYRLEGIASSAKIHPGAVVGENCAVGENVVISDGVRIGNNCKIFHNAVILEDCQIGNGTVIFPNVTLREECVIGNNVIIHSGAVIGGDGFGYVRDSSGNYQKVPQVGNVVLEDYVEIGCNATIDRAALGSTIIRSGTKIDNLVQIAHNVEVGSKTAISAQTGISGSTVIGDNCIVAGQVGFVDHIEISDGVIIAAQSGVSKSIKEPGIYWGYPAKNLKEGRKTEAHIRNLAEYARRIAELEEKVKKLEGE